jgi:hypothetical protein
MHTLEDTVHKHEAMELIRSLIEKIELTPKEGGLDAVLYGDLARILSLCSAGQPQAEQQQFLRRASSGG